MSKVKGQKSGQRYKVPGAGAGGRWQVAGVYQGAGVRLKPETCTFDLHLNLDL
jgi:hypothetical protein